MKKTYRLEGLGCAHCASKMEKAVKALDGVSDASINFMTTKMVIEGDDAKFEDIIKSAAGIIKKIEPDVILKKA